MIFIIVSGGPDEIIFSKYFSSYKEAESILLNNGFIKSVDSFGMVDYHNERWDEDFKIDGELSGFQAYITELSSYR